MYLGKFTYKNGGLVRMDPGGPAGSGFQASYDPSKTPAENMELNRRAQAAGHNSVAEYEASGWAWQPKQAQAPSVQDQVFTGRYGVPGKASNVDMNKAASAANYISNEYKPLDEKERSSSYEAKRLEAQNIARQSNYPNDPAGLPSVPIFEAAFMAPVALSSAGALGTSAVEGAGSLVGQGFNTVKNFAQPGVNAWNSLMNTKLLGDAAIGASTGETVLANLATPANLLKGWGIYDATNKYIPNAISDVSHYAETGNIQDLKDAGYNAAKGVLELGSHTGPLVHEVQAIKKPISFIDDSRKMLDSDKALADRGASGFKTIKNVMGYLKEQGGDISLPNLKRVKIKSLPKNWKSQ